MHEYMKRLLLAQKLGIIDKGSIAFAEVAHDDFCKMGDGGMCNCDPLITIKASGKEFMVQKDGTVMQA